MPLMSQGQYARHAGVSQQAISKAVRAGKIPLVEGRIDSDLADAVWCVHRNGAATGGATPLSSEPIPNETAPHTAESDQPALEFVAPPPGSAAAEQAGLYRARREKLEIELQVKRDEIVSRREVQQAFDTAMINFRHRLLNIPDEIIDQGVRAWVLLRLTEALQDLSKLRIESISQESSAA